MQIRKEDGSTNVNKVVDFQNFMLLRGDKAVDEQYTKKLNNMSSGEVLQLVFTLIDQYNENESINKTISTNFGNIIDHLSKGKLDFWNYTKIYLKIIDKPNAIEFIDKINPIIYEKMNGDYVTSLDSFVTSLFEKYIENTDDQKTDSKDLSPIQEVILDTYGNFLDHLHADTIGNYRRNEIYWKIINEPKAEPLYDKYNAFVIKDLRGSKDRIDNFVSNVISNFYDENKQNKAMVINTFNTIFNDIIDSGSKEYTATELLKNVEKITEYDKRRWLIDTMVPSILRKLEPTNISAKHNKEFLHRALKYDYTTPPETKDQKLTHDNLHNFLSEQLDYELLNTIILYDHNYDKYDEKYKQHIAELLLPIVLEKNKDTQVSFNTNIIYKLISDLNCEIKGEDGELAWEIIKLFPSQNEHFDKRFDGLVGHIFSDKKISKEVKMKYFNRINDHILINKDKIDCDQTTEIRDFLESAYDHLEEKELVAGKYLQYISSLKEWDSIYICQLHLLDDAMSKANLHQILKIASLIPIRADGERETKYFINKIANRIVTQCKEPLKLQQITRELDSRISDIIINDHLKGKINPENPLHTELFLKYPKYENDEGNAKALLAIMKSAFIYIKEEHYDLLVPYFNKYDNKELNQAIFNFFFETRYKQVTTKEKLPIENLRRIYKDSTLFYKILNSYNKDRDQDGSQKKKILKFIISDDSRNFIYSNDTSSSFDYPGGEFYRLINFINDNKLKSKDINKMLKDEKTSLLTRQILLGIETKK